MRLKHRFLICQVDFGADRDAAGGTSPADLFAAIRTSMLDVYGDAGWGACASVLAVKYFSPVTRLALVRVPCGFAEQARAAVALVKTVRKRPAAIHTLQVAGSVRTLQAYLAHWHASATAALKASAAADDVQLDAAFLEALDADLADAVPVAGKGGR